jgi:hypothetical protein
MRESCWPCNYSSLVAAVVATLETLARDPVAAVEGVAWFCNLLECQLGRSIKSGLVQAVATDNPAIFLSLITSMLWVAEVAEGSPLGFYTVLLAAEEMLVAL